MCSTILESKPKAIRSVDRKDKMQSVIHIAMENRDTQMLQFLAKQPYVDFEIGDVNNETPLYVAIRQRDLEAVEYLVNDCKVDIEHRECQMRSPLYYAASTGDLEMTRYMVKKGGDVDAKSL